MSFGTHIFIFKCNVCMFVVTSICIYMHVNVYKAKDKSHKYFLVVLQHIVETRTLTEPGAHRIDQLEGMFKRSNCLKPLGLQMNTTHDILCQYQVSEHSSSCFHGKNLWVDPIHWSYLCTLINLQQIYSNWCHVNTM